MTDEHKHCACDYVVDLTAQLDNETLNQLFTQAIEHVINDVKINWVFKELQDVSDYSHSDIELVSDGKVTLVKVWLAKQVIAETRVNKFLNKKETGELKTLAKVYINQKRHVSLSSTDQLTGVLNRQAFNEKIKLHCRPNEFKEKRQFQSKKCLALLDIDHFKRINDKFGHLIGDEVLVILGQKLNLAFRDDDLCFRYGGEEFAIILTNVNLELSMTIFERFRKSIEHHVFPQVGQITVSIGVADYHEFVQPSELISQADRALYYAKDHGRNQVHNYQALVAKGLLAADEAGSDIEFL